MTTQSESSQQEEQQNKNNTIFSIESQTDWQKLNVMKDEDIDLSDIPELNKEQLRQMKPLSQVLPRRSVKAQPTSVSTLIIYHEDGRISTHQLASASNVIVLEPDVQRYFPDSTAVNRALRALIDLIPQPH
ncbi:MAG: hypothetical protein U0350_35170 [Caldilineaceae bacterium]